MKTCATCASHPSRVRGLKPTGEFTTSMSTPSHPSRVRGLKPLYRLWPRPHYYVAPLAGAWIETSRKRLSKARSGGSHPSRVRGLKQQSGFIIITDI